MAGEPFLGTVVLFLTALSGLTGTFLTYYAIRQGSTAARAYAFVTALATLWSYSFLVQLLGVSREVTTLSYYFVVFFAVLSPFAWFTFTLIWTDRQEWLRHPLVLALWSNPFLYLFLFYTGIAPSLVLSTSEITTFAGLTLVIPHDTFLETLQVLFYYAIILVASGLLGHAYIESRNVYRRQTGLLLAGSVTVFASSVIWFAGLAPHPNLDLTPVLLVLNTIIAGYAIFGYGALRRTPVTASTIIDALSEPVVVVDPDGTVTDANDIALEALPDLAIGNDIEDAIPSVEHAATEGVPYSIPGNPERSIYEVDVTPATDSDGDLLAYTYHFQNVTDRVHREDTLSALHVASRQLTAAESQEEIAEITRDALVDALSFDLAAVLLHDEETNRLQPTAITDELANAISGVFQIDPSESFIWDVYESGEPFLGSLGEDIQRQHPEIDLSHVAAIPLGDHGVLGAGSDDGGHDALRDDRFLKLLSATAQASLDRAEREAELREQRREVAAQHERIEFFNSLLRHDLLNGLMVVRGHVELLVEHFEEDDVETEDARARLRVVDRWTTDMADLIQRIRSVIDTLSGGAAPIRERTAIGPILREKAEKLEASHESSTVTVEVDDVEVYADALLSDVLGNLIFNAVEHHDRDEQHIDLTTEVSDDTVEIRVADDGPGIPDDKKDRIFDKDYTTRGNGTLGFGLYFVAVTVERYGGSVRVEDNEPRGTVIVVELPRENGQADVAADARSDLDGGGRSDLDTYAQSDLDGGGRSDINTDAPLGTDDPVSVEDGSGEDPTDS